MKSFQSYSSVPMLRGRKASGVNGEGRVFLPPHIRDLMKLSALQWRKNNGQLTLFTDSTMLRYLKKLDMLHYWDKIDVSVLDEFYANSRIDTRVFWSAPKFACYKILNAPLVCVDVDLIAWKKLNIEKDADFSFTHWERVEYGDYNYPPLKKINAPQGYRFHKKKHYGSLAANMSVSYFGNDEFLRDFVAEAFSFMEEEADRFNINDPPTTPEILYMEQRLPLAIANEKKLKIKPVINTVWSPKKYKFIKNDPLYGNYFLSDLDTDKPLSHLWVHKRYLETNAAARHAYFKKLRELLAEAENDFFGGITRSNHNK